MRVVKFCRAIAAVVACQLLLAVQAWAAPPVRIAVIAASGSGMEQEMANRISDDLSQNYGQGQNKVVISTVNPDWFVQCTITRQTDTAGGSVMINGTVVIKATDGQVLDTLSMQTNKQDFSLQPGTPVNKRLFDNAAREVIQGIADQVRQKMPDIIEREIDTRNKIIKAQELGDQDKYPEALAILSPITPDTPHFKGVRQLIGELEMEQEALELVTEAQKLGKAGSYQRGIETLKQVDPASKRQAMAKALITKFKAALAAKRPRRPAPVKAKSGGSGSDEQLKALEAQKKALDAQKKAVEAQEAALRSKQK